MVLVDTSVWIDYFKGGESVEKMNYLIDCNEICLNDVILSELIPSLNLKNETELKAILLDITKLPLSINWAQIIAFQTQNLKQGFNKIGLPDLIILQNAVNNEIPIYTLDKHFSLMADSFGLELY